MPSITLNESASASASTDSQKFVAESAAARDSITTSGFSIFLADKAITRDSMVSNVGNIGNGRYLR
jgi:hypothetical protein